MCTARIIIDKYKKEGLVFDRTQRKFIVPEIPKKQEANKKQERQEQDESEGRGEREVKEEEKQYEEVNNPEQIEGRESKPELTIESIKEEAPWFSYYQLYSI